MNAFTFIKKIDITLLVVLVEISLCCGFPSSDVLKQCGLQLYQGNLMKLSSVELNKLKTPANVWITRESL